MLIHAPAPWAEMGNRTKSYDDENMEVWLALEEAVKAGKIRSIGISNFNNYDTQNILDNCTIKPAVNQICYHIGFTQTEIRDFCRDNGILVEAYSPIATGELLNHADVAKVAEKYHKTPAQICIRFTLQECDISLPKTTHREFMEQNADVDFEISEADMEILRNVAPVTNW